MVMYIFVHFFFFKQKTAYEMRISDWSSDVCSSDLMAEDCLQDTLIAALRAYPRLRHRDNLRAWLYTIAHRKATDVIRLRARRPTTVQIGRASCRERVCQYV